MVRLYDLPTRTNIDHINSFFQGLDPQYVFILPVFNNTIHGFDDYLLNKDRGYSDDDTTITSRYFCLYVQFKSKSIANIALSRSGETIQIINQNGEIHQVSKVSLSRAGKKAPHDVKSSFPIVIKHVSEHIATYIQQYEIAIIIPCSSPIRKGHDDSHSFVSLSNEVQKYILNIVNDILWVMIHQHLLYEHGNDVSLNIDFIGGRRPEVSCSNIATIDK